MTKINRIRITLYVVGILCIALITQVVVNNIFHDESRITDAFTSTNPGVTESHLQVVADYGKKFLSENDKKNLIAYIAGSLGLDNNYTLETRTGKNASSILAVKEAKFADTTMEVISVSREKSGQSAELQQYILVKLVLRGDTKSVLAYKDILEKTMKELNASDYQSAIELKGVFEGELTMDEKNNVANKLLKSLQAKVISENRENDLFTVYAYTGLINEYISISRNKVNINVAILYDEELDQTTVCMATPILNSDY